MWPISTQQLLEANGTPTVQAHRDAIHKRIRDVKEELRVLDNCLNSIASVNRLPVEVLSMVFAAHVSLVAEDYRPWDRESLAAVRVGHVCQRWRNVALDCAEIWARPLFHNLELAKYAVKKSQSHDIVLRSVGYQGTNRSADVLPLYFEAITPINRLQSLEIDQGEVGRDLLSTLVGPAPLLEKVSLSFFDSPQDWEVLPNNLLQGGAPLLKKFSIKNMWIPAMEKLPLAAGLTHLHLETKSDLEERYETPSSKVFFGVLRNLPLLKSLYLSDYLPRDWESDSIKPDISLPNLEDLVLEDGAEEMYNFFNPIKIPRAETVSLNIIHAPAIDDDHLAALESLLEAWGKKKKTKVKASLQEFSTAINFMEVIKFKFKFDSAWDEDPPRLTVSLPGVSRASGGRYLSSISNLMPISSLTCLRVRGELSAEQWRPFSHIGSLRRITIKNANSTAGFITAMEETPTQDATADSKRAKSTLAFPALHTLEFTNVNFPMSRGRGSPEDFRRVLAGRPAEHRITTFVIWECGSFRKQDRERLESVPGLDLLWDEHDGGMYEVLEFFGS